MHHRPEQAGLVEPPLEWSGGQVPGFGWRTPDAGVAQIGLLQPFEQRGRQSDRNMPEDGERAVRRKHLGGFRKPHLRRNPVPRLGGNDQPEPGAGRGRCFEGGFGELDVAELRQALGGSANHLGSGVNGENPEAASCEASGRLTRTAANFEHRIVGLQGDVRDDIVDQRVGIVGTRGLVDPRDLIECKALLHDMPRRLASVLACQVVLKRSTPSVCSAFRRPSTSM